MSLKRPLIPICVFCIDVVVSMVIIVYRDYTNIDWSAYMSEVSGWNQHNFSLVYTELKGDTGPLVYPAAFVYIYNALYYLTNQGVDILTAKVIFLFVYLYTQAAVMGLYYRAQPLFSPYYNWLYVMLSISPRIHSIYLLRFFNDAVAVLMLYISLHLLYVGKGTLRQYLGCIVYSLAVGTKMSILLFAPGIFAIWVRTYPARQVARFIVLCGFVQLLIGAPFLAIDSMAYISKSFELGRVFTQKWSVNYSFLPNYIFIHPYFSLALLFSTVVVMAVFALARWYPRTYVDKTGLRGHGTHKSMGLFLQTVFESNIIGDLIRKVPALSVLCLVFPYFTISSLPLRPHQQKGPSL